MAQNQSLSTQEVADILHVSKSTIYDLIRKGEIHSYKIGRKVRFTQDEVYTDQNIEFRICEIIRGEAINRLKDELPHCIYVSVADLEQRGQNGKYWVRAFLCVEQETQDMR